MEFSEHERRLAVVVTALVGLAHLAVPGVLLRTARVGYARLLAVEFRPTSGARRRVRAVGVTFLALAAALWRYTAVSR